EEPSGGIEEVDWLFKVGRLGLPKPLGLFGLKVVPVDKGPVSLRGGAAAREVERLSIACSEQDQRSGRRVAHSEVARIGVPVFERSVKEELSAAAGVARRDAPGAGAPGAPPAFVDDHEL